MTKKQFIALADHIKRENAANPDNPPFSGHAIEKLSAFCKASNPQFNKWRWLRYIRGECGPNGGSINKHMDER